MPKIDILSSAILSVKVKKQIKKELLTCMINPWKSSVTTPRPFAANQSPCNTWNLFILEKKNMGSKNCLILLHCEFLSP